MNKMLVLVGLVLAGLSGLLAGGAQMIVVGVGAFCFFSGLSSGHPRYHAHNK